MGDISEEIRAFEGMQAELEAQHMGSWVVIREGKLIGVFDSFEQAAEEATKQFGIGPFLIREVGAAPTNLPISVMYAWNAQR